MIADLGAEGHEIFEPCLATTRTRRLAAYRSVGSVLRAASATSQSATWRAGDILPPGGGFQGQDATVAVVDPETDTFVVFAISAAFGGSPSLRSCSFTPAGGFSNWAIAFDSTSELITAIDKPWIVRRTASDFYAFFFTGGDYQVLRSSNGTTWSASSAAVVQTSEGPVLGKFCMQPAVGADGRIYAAYATDIYGALGGKVRILIGEATSGGLSFKHMQQPDGSLLEWTPRHSQGDNLPAPSGPTGELEIPSKTVPYLVCDPSDWTRVYVAYPDSAEDDEGDMNVYLARLHGDSNDRWTLLSNQPIHGEVVSPEGVRADQIIPTPIVDGAGRVHVVYYDNRPACGGSGFSVVYDAWHALSTDHGATFTIRNLRTSCDADPAMNLGLPTTQLQSGWSPREYNGIAAYQSGTESRVWIVYAGTSLDPGDDPAHRSVLFGQQIVVTQAP